MLTLSIIYLQATSWNGFKFYKHFHYMYIVLAMTCIGYDLPVFLLLYFSEPFTASIGCSEQYQSGDEITFRFSITNSHHVNYYILRWYTSLEGMRSSSIFVTRNGIVVPYDGIL